MMRFCARIDRSPSYGRDCMTGSLAAQRPEMLHAPHMPRKLGPGLLLLALLVVAPPAWSIEDEVVSTDIAPPEPSAPFLEMVGDAPRPGISGSDTGVKHHLTDLTEIATPDTDWLEAAAVPERRGALMAVLLEAHEAELRFEFEDAARGFEQLAGEIETAPYPAWRASRAWWRASDLVPESDMETRGDYLDRAEALAKEGIERDPGCAECMLWRYASLGRLATVRGLLSAARNARTMKKLLNQGIELKPTRKEGQHNSTLGNLYYASAVFNRMVPESFWLRLVVGVSGDKERAVADAKQAVALHPKRVDYQVEFGAALLCLGTEKGRDEAIHEGRSVLSNASEFDRLLPTDDLDLEFARIMAQRPELACSFSRDGFIDVKKAAKAL